MRLFELEGPDRKVYSTNRFDKEFIQELRAHTDLQGILLNFINFRKNARNDAPFNRKDYAYSHGDLKGFRHCHLIFGKVIAIYQSDAKSIYLCSIGGHAQYDGNNPKIGSYLRNLTASDFHTFAQSKEQSGALPPKVSDPKVRQRLQDILYMLSEDSKRYILKKMAAGDMAQFTAIASSLGITKDDVASIFASRDALAQAAQKVLNDTAPKN